MTTELTLIERIQNNDNTLTELRLTEAPATYCNPTKNNTLTDLFTALCQNTIIEYVRIDRDFLPCMIQNNNHHHHELESVSVDDNNINNNKYEMIELFFIALGSIISLKEVHIWHAAFPVNVLYGFLNSQKQQLEVLELGCLELTGTNNDFHLIAQSITKYHTTLHTFHMIDFVINTTTTTVSTQHETELSNTNTMNGIESTVVSSSSSSTAVVSSLDEIVLAVGTIPTIEVIKIEVTASRRRSLCGPIESLIQPKIQLSGTTIASVLLNTKSVLLQELILTRIPFTYDDYTIISSALYKCCCTNIKKLKVVALPHCNVTDDVCTLLCPSLTINTTLETLDLSCNKITDTGCILIASSLKSYNTTSTSISTIISNDATNNNNNETTSGSKIKVLRLWGNIKISTDGYNALLEMLQSNCYLQRIPLMAPYEYGQKIDIALLKNRISTINTSINANATTIGSDSNVVPVSNNKQLLPMIVSTPSSPIKKLGMTTNRAA